jgi:Protein of unknown function (DUF3703)
MVVARVHAQGRVRRTQASALRVAGCNGLAQHRRLSAVPSACRHARFDRSCEPVPDRFRRFVAKRCPPMVQAPKVQANEDRSSSTLEGWNMLKAYNTEVSLAALALQCRSFDECFVHLERAHVLAQRMTLRHIHVHGLMLLAGLHRRDWREVAGQLPRIVASALFSRLWVPPGNTGRARVSAFKPMPVPEDLRHLFP